VCLAVCICVLTDNNQDQTLSASTATALHFLNQQHISKFEYIIATAESCQVVDRIDFLNSKSIFSKHYKSPITKNNIVDLENKIISLIKYLYTMKFNDQILHTTNKKTFIYDFVVAVKSLLGIARSIFVNDSINSSYILTYKFSQDHLELFFCQIKQRGGSNNNPNVVQLKIAIKQILIKNAFKLKNNGNCNMFYDDVMCSILDFKWYKKEQFNDTCQTGEADQDILNRIYNSLTIKVLLYKVLRTIFYTTY